MRRLLLLPIFCLASVTLYAQGSCGSQPNPIVCENALQGNPQSDWDFTGNPAGDPTIQGFATNISVNRGQPIQFKINTNATSYWLDIYRMGYYGGLGARKVVTILPSASLPQNQPACLTDASTGLMDCGNWAVSASWTVPNDAVSGIYFADVIRPDTFGQCHIVFIVRNDASHSDILFQTSDTSWEAYNSYGGNSLYQGSPVGRAYKVSYNRPYNTRAMGNGGELTWVFSAEYPMVRWLEANGYDVSYSTGVDTDRNGSLLLNHKVFLSVGHDEYWSLNQRSNVESARAAGVNLAFFSGNEVFWKTRWENSIADGAPYRTLVCYKETHANARIDPLDVSPTWTWTGTWRDPRFSPPSDGNRPENALTGPLFMVSGARNDAITVPASYRNLRFWRNTSIATLPAGQVYTFPVGTLGYEWDQDTDNGFRPAGLFDLSSTTLDVSGFYLIDYGTTWGPGTATHNMTLYRASSSSCAPSNSCGALVFGAGTVQWSWGLDANHDNLGGPADINMQQATVNLLADMRVQPASLQPGLLPASASTDTSPPVSTITSPASGSNYVSGSPVTVTGTATDVGGGVVAAVEISTDGGTTWHPASGRQNWSYTFTPPGVGTLAIKSRAVDDSGNLEIPSGGVTLNVTLRPCPCTIWPSTAGPVTLNTVSNGSVELGVQFKSDVPGYITGVRFYKLAADTSAHMGNLWSSTGTLLASAPFSGESGSGWQQVNFSSPVAINANTVYVASYHTSAAYLDQNYFATAGVDNAPLHALANGVSGGNGVYVYAATSTFPNNSFQSSNYWVDVVFDSTGQLVISTTSLPNGLQSAPYSQTLTAVGGTTPYGWSLASGTLPAGLGLSSGGQISGTPTSTGSSTFTARVNDASSLTKTATQALTLTIAPIPACPCTIWPSTAKPVTSNSISNGSVELGVKFKSDVSGRVTGVRFYKLAADTSAHVGNLWSSTGTLLASAPFSGESASGWQQVNFSSPVAINANTVYVASYHTSAAYLDQNYFATAGVDNAPLHALANGVSGGNGVYVYGATSTFPNNSFQSSNYWVDAVFNRP